MGKNVTKADLVSHIASETGLKKVEAEKALVALTDAIRSALTDGRRVTLVGFGTFSVASRKARMGVDPRSKERIQIPAKKGVKFKAGKRFREAVND